MESNFPVGATEAPTAGIVHAVFVALERVQDAVAETTAHHELEPIAVAEPVGRS